MYIKKVEAFRNRFPESKCISGMVISDVEGLPVGSPVIARIDPFVGVVGIDPQGDHIYYKECSNRIEARSLIGEDPQVINQMLPYSVSKLIVIYPFFSLRGSRNSENPFEEIPVASQNFNFKSEVPIIYDKFFYRSVTSFTEEFSKAAMHDMEGALSDYFKSHRYLNFLFTDLAKSKESKIIIEVCDLIQALKAAYPQSKGILRGGAMPRVLIDEVSVSFYKLMDVIPIYDVRKTKGVVVEVVLSSSVTESASDIMSAYTVWFIFSKEKDGVFTIDGEKIARPGEYATSKCVGTLCEMLKVCMPNDVNSKFRNKKVKVEEV